MVSWVGQPEAPRLGMLASPLEFTVSQERVDGQCGWGEWVRERRQVLAVGF